MDKALRISLICSCLPAAGRSVYESVGPDPSPPAGSAADGVPPSAYSSPPAARTETQPAGEPQLVSLHHRWTHLGDISKEHSNQPMQQHHHTAWILTA